MKKKVTFKFCEKIFEDVIFEGVAVNACDILKKVVYHKVMFTGLFWVVQLEICEKKLAYHKVIGQSAADAIKHVENTLTIYKVEDTVVDTQDKGRVYNKENLNPWDVGKKSGEDIVASLKKMFNM